MLVKPSRLHDRGSTLVSVIVVMLVLTVIALTTAAVTVNTTRGLVTTRTTAQARAAADAGLAAVIAAFRREGDCPAPLPSSPTDDLRYTTTCDDSSSSQVIFTSTGEPDTAAASKIEAVYRLPATAPQKEAALITRAPLALDSLTIKAVDASDPSTVWVIPDSGVAGDFKCDHGGAIAGSVYLPTGGVYGSGGCVVAGDVYGKGDMTIGGGTKLGGDVVSPKGGAEIGGGSASGGGVYAEGSITIRTGAKMAGDVVSQNGNVTLIGGPKIDGSIHAKGNVTASGLSGNDVQSIYARGNLTLGDSNVPVARDKIAYGGTFTHPTYHGDAAWAANSVTKTTTQPVVNAPELPIKPEWVGFSQDDLDALVGANLFAKVTWTGACTHSWNHPMKAVIEGLTSPTLVDASMCSRVDLPSQWGDLKLKSDVIFVAPSFNLVGQNFISGDDQEHRIWIISPEIAGRNCAAVPVVNVEGVKMSPKGKSKISGMIFTQCTVHFANGSEEWQGSIQAGKMTGKPNFWYQPVGFPGHEAPGAGDDDDAGGAGSLVLVSLREVAPK